MANPSKGLGRGLAALLGDDVMTPEEEKTSLYLPISQVESCASQPRKQFDPDALADLADSIREHGIIQPLTVRKLQSGYYQIIAGERRWRAARMAGLSEVPAIVIEADDRKAAELAHNHGRGADIEILEEQGLVDGLKKVEAEGHQQRRQDDGHERGEKAGQRRAEAGRQRGYRGHPVLFHDEEQGDDQKSEQSRHFAQRLHKAVVRRRKMGAFHRKVRVEECPPLIAERRTQRDGCTDCGGDEHGQKDRDMARQGKAHGVDADFNGRKGWCGKRKYSGESRVVLNARKSERFA